MSDLSPTTLELDDAATSLGARHPLTRALHCQRVAVRHLAAVTLLGGIAAAGTRTNLTWGPPLLVAAAAVAAVLGSVIAGATWWKHRAATELIAHGREHLAIASVTLQRKRLLHPAQAARRGGSVSSADQAGQSRDVAAARRGSITRSSSYRNAATSPR